MKKDYSPPPGFRINKRMSDVQSTCVTCMRCHTNESRYDNNLRELTRSLLRHVCSLPTVQKKDLYFHKVPEYWPYASKGQNPADIPSLASWILALPATFREELLSLITAGSVKK